MTARVLVLSDDDVRRVLSPEHCERAMADVLAARARGEADMPLRSVWVPERAPGFMGLMPAYAADAGGPERATAGVGPEWEAPSRNGCFALKALCLMPGNPARGLDTHQGTVTLFDGETGRPLAILNASAVTEIRTAAVTAAATRALARPGARVLTILGGGVQARSHLRALARVRAWEQMRVYAPTAAHAHAAVERAAAEHAAGGGPPAVVVGSARAAVEGADVVVTVTNSREPVIEHAWLAAGAHVNAVGASTPRAQELDVETVAAAALFCDSRESVAHEAGEFQLAVAQGAIAGIDHVRAELGEVLTGTAPGRTGDGELTVFRSLGIAVEDLAAAELAVATARGLGVGAEVAL